MANSITVTLVEDAPIVPDPFLSVKFRRDGRVVILADSYTAARLAGRDEFGSVEDVQAQLRDKIADAWYAAGCPA